jgi:hypothetical protein
MDETATTRPAKAGESVTSSVIQGMVIITTEFDIPEKKLEIWRKKIGIREP